MRLGQAALPEKRLALDTREPPLNIPEARARPGALQKLVRCVPLRAAGDESPGEAKGRCNPPR